MVPRIIRNGVKDAEDAEFTAVLKKYNWVACLSSRFDGKAAGCGLYCIGGRTSAKTLLLTDCSYVHIY